MSANLTNARWTVVRVPRLVDGPARGTYRVAHHVGRETGMKLSREALARFILDELDTGAYIHALPVVSA